MKINHNLSAMIANNQLLRNENSLSASIERLSSGLKINHAADDAAGMAIATKMRAQIKGLDQASRNASDGVSVVETADGALQEVTSMIQRMRELSVQAANEIYVMEDKEAIQAEIESLTEEINRISTDTEFNKKKLLDGSLDQRVYTNTRSVSRIDISDAVTSDQYTVTVVQDARQAVLVGGNPIGTGDIPAGIVSINGVDVEITQGQDISTVYANLRDAAEEGEVNLFVVDDATTNTDGKPQNAGYTPTALTQGTSRMVFVSDAYGSSAEIKITCDNDELANYLGFSSEAVVIGIDAKITLQDGFTKQASYICDGSDVVITDRTGFEMSFRIGAGSAGTTFTDVQTGVAGSVESAEIIDGAGEEIIFDVTEIGTMTLQIGANENQVMDIRIPSVSAEALHIDGINVCTINGAGRAITAYDEALAKVSESRARMGAYQNRLEQTVNSLDSTEENMTAALSRIEDVDMAEEMSAYTQYNVLTQAATSVLAQANDIPQQALQLLQ